MPLTVSEILNYKPQFHRQRTGEEISWELPREVLEYIESHAGPDMRTIETGAGVSTVVFASRGCRHTTVVPDEGQVNRIRGFCQNHDVALDKLQFIVTRSQDALPSLNLGEADIALIDGSHSFPVAFLDFFYRSRLTKIGGILIIDNTNLWTGHIIKKFLLREPEWKMENDFPISAVFRKLSDHNLDKDWTDQPYNLNQSYKYLIIGKMRRVRWLLRQGRYGYLLRKFFEFRWIKPY